MATNSVIEQQPLYDVLPVGQEIIFVVSNQPAVANETKVKFCVEVHISSTTPPVISTTNDLKGTFKTTPNNAGVGIFDLRNVLENYVKADNRTSTDNTGITGPQYKGTYVNENTYPLHIVDKFSRAPNCARFMALKFYVEYLGATNSGVTDPNVVARQDGTDVNSAGWTIFNGYVKYTDIINEFQNDFGFNTLSLTPSDNSRRFLTNAPMVQYANYNDYGTVAFLQPNATSAIAVHSFIINYYGSDGVLISTVTIPKQSVTGAYNNWSLKAEKIILFLGCFPGNLQNWATSNIPSAALLEGGHILISAVDSVLGATINALRININCPETKNFEPIRLAWLNQYGAWDYYTFTKKSVKNTSTQGSTYQQLGGTWNESLYRTDSYKGGKKSFRINATEKITMNTNFVSEDDNVMFEELINSPEIYLLDGFQTDGGLSSLNNYVKPVRLTTSSFTRKTVANDRLMQYTFEIEKSKTLRTQSI